EVLRPIVISQFFAGQLTDAEATFRQIDEISAQGGYVNVGEILLWRALVLVAAGDLARAEAVARELEAFAATSTPHTRGHAFGTELVAAYRSELWWERNAIDSLGFNPAIALVIAGRHAEALEQTAQVERFGATGSRVAGALAAAIREELGPRSGADGSHAAL